MNNCLFERVSQNQNALISHSKAPKKEKQGVRNTKVATKKKKASYSKCVSFTKKGKDWLEVMMPIFTVSEANGGAKVSFIRNGKTCYKNEHWSEKNRRHQLQRGTVALLLRPHRESLSLPCHITLTRYAPDKLDRFDNLPMSMKYVLDAICEVITGDYRPGRADSHEGIRDVKYEQVVNKEYGVSVLITMLGKSTL